MSDLLAARARASGLSIRRRTGSVLAIQLWPPRGPERRPGRRSSLTDATSGPGTRGALLNTCDPHLCPRAVRAQAHQWCRLANVRHAAHWRSKVPGGSEVPRALAADDAKAMICHRGLRARAGAQPFVGGRLVIAPQRAQVHSLWRKLIRRRACMRAQGLAGSLGFDDPRPATRNPGRSQRLATYGPERSGPPGPAQVTALHSFNSFRLELMGASRPRRLLFANTWSL